MVLGIGVDLIAVPRIAGFLERRGRRGLERIFSAGELAYCLDLARPAPSLAARFAAKEAFFKALGTGYGAGGRWAEVEVTRSESGRPELRLHGRAAEHARLHGVRRTHLSLSHTAEMVVALVVLED